MAIALRSFKLNLQWTHLICPTSLSKPCFAQYIDMQKLLTYYRSMWCYQVLTLTCHNCSKWPKHRVARPVKHVAWRYQLTDSLIHSGWRWDLWHQGRQQKLPVSTVSWEVFLVIMWTESPALCWKSDSAYSFPGEITVTWPIAFLTSFKVHKTLWAVRFYVSWQSHQKKTVLHC